MFKVPDWGDTPNSIISFKKDRPEQSKKKNKKCKTPQHPKQVLQIKPKFKAKTKTKSKLKLTNKGQQKNKHEKRHKNNINHTILQNQEKHNLRGVENSSSDPQMYKKDSDYGIKIKNYNSEMILDVKKQELKTHKNDDKEDNILFYGSPINIKKNKNNSLYIASNTAAGNFTGSTESIEKCKQHPNSSEVEKESSLSNGSEKKIDFGKLRKKKVLQSILQKSQENSRKQINVNGSKLRERMLDRLKAAKFRYLNEKLYTSSGSEAQQLFQGDPDAFHTYHQGYQQQLQKWPVKPLDLIVKRIQKMPKTHVIADMGCGQAELARRVAQPVRSFDLVAGAPGVEPCDMARTPLAPRSVQAAVYCLALMGTRLTDCLLEANRVLAPGGHLLIAEVESRFDSIDTFISDVQRLGFSLKKLDDSHRVFYFFEFTKVRDPPVKKGKIPTLTLKPCIYKKR